MTVGLFMVPFAPYMVAGTFGMPDTFFPYITSKAFYFRIVVEIVFACWLVLALRVPEYRPKFSWITALITIFVAFMLFVNVFIAIDPHKAIWSNFERMEGWWMIAHLWMYFIAISSFFTNREWWKKWFIASLAASLLVVIFAFTQLTVSSKVFQEKIRPALSMKITCLKVPNVSMGDCFASKFAIRQGGDRVDGTLGNATYLAVYMMIHVFLAVYMILHVGGWRRKNIWRWALGILAALEMFVIFKTATRGTAAGLVVGVVIGALLIAIFEREHKLLRKISAGIFIATVVFVTAFWSVRDAKFVQEDYILSRFASIFSLEQIKSQARIAYIWPMAFQGAAERPVFGWGQDGFNYVFNKYYDPGFYNQEQWFDRAHNVFLDWLIAGGIPGLVLYITLYVVFLVYIWKSKNLTIVDKSLFTALLVGYSIHNMLVFDNISSYILFFSLLGFIHTETVHEKKVITDKKIQVDVQNLIVIPVIVIAGFCMLYFVNYKPMRVANTLVQAISANPKGPLENLELFKKALAYDSVGKQEVREQLYSISETLIKSAVGSDVKVAFFELARLQAVEQAKETPQDARGYYLFAGFLNRVGQSEPAYAYALKALELSPKKQTMMFEVAMSLIQMKKIDEGIAVAEKAYLMAPTYEEAKTLYAASLIYGNRLADAEKLYNGVLPLSPRIVASLEDVKKYVYLINRYKKVVKENPTDLQAHLFLAAQYFNLGDNASSIAEVREISKINPQYKAEVEQLVEQIKLGKFPVAR